jgi:hypothetical protein
MRPPEFIVRANECLYAEVSLVAFFGLAHARITFALLIGRVDAIVRTPLISSER